jgi:hypothetical protein
LVVPLSPPSPEKQKKKLMILSLRMQQFSLIIIPFLACGSKNNPILGLHLIKAATTKFKKKTFLQCGYLSVPPNPMTKMGVKNIQQLFATEVAENSPELLPNFCY